MKAKIKKILLKLGLIISVIMLIIGLTLMWLTYFFDPNNYKTYLSKKFNEYTGRNLVLTGQIKIGFLPSLHVQASNLAIPNPDNFKPGNFIYISSLTTNLSWLSLLKGSIKINDLTVDGLQINLVEKKSLDNWTFKDFNDQQEEGTELTPTLVLNKLRLINCRLSYAYANTMWQSAPFNLAQEEGSVNFYMQKIDANEVVFKINNIHVSGNASLSFLPLYKLEENLTLGPIQLSDIIDLNGYQIKFESAHINGNLNGTESSLALSHLTGKQDLKINNITLRGLSLKRFNIIINQSINSISRLKRFIKPMEVRAVLSQLKAEIDKMRNIRQKNYAQVSQLGDFRASVSVKNGLLSIQTCILNGPDIQGMCGGYVNFNDNTINYLVLGQIQPVQKPEVINYIYLPYRVYGKIPDITTGIDWQYTSQQLGNYYDNKKVTFYRLLDKNPGISITNKPEKAKP